MTEQILALNRMRDVGLSLRAAGIHGQFLNRIRLQKFVYLTDALSFLYEILPPIQGHVTYLHGPYDVVLQNAVDSLAFRGMAQIVTVAHGYDGVTQTTYRLSQAGEKWADGLALAFPTKCQAASDVAARVNSIGWGFLVQLVYAEPTYVSTSPVGYGQQLRPEDGLSNTSSYLVETITQTIAHGYGSVSFDRALLLDLFFRYLVDYAGLGASNGEAE